MKPLRLTLVSILYVVVRMESHISLLEAHEDVCSIQEYFSKEQLSTRSTTEIHRLANLKRNYMFLQSLGMDQCI